MKIWFHCKKAKENPKILTIRINSDEAAWIVNGLWEIIGSIKNSLTPETKKDIPKAYAQDTQSVKELLVMTKEINDALLCRGKHERK